MALALSLLLTGDGHSRRAKRPATHADLFTAANDYVAEVAAAVANNEEAEVDDENNKSNADAGLGIALSLSMAEIMADGKWASTAAKRQATTAAPGEAGSSSGSGTVQEDEQGYDSSDEQVLLVSPAGGCSAIR